MPLVNKLILVAVHLVTDGYYQGFSRCQIVYRVDVTCLAENVLLSVLYVERREACGL